MQKYYFFWGYTQLFASFLKKNYCNFVAQIRGMFHFLQKYNILLLLACTILLVCMGFELWNIPVTFTPNFIQQPYAQSLAKVFLSHLPLFTVSAIFLFILQILLLFIYYKRSNYAEENIFFPIFWILLLSFTSRYLSSLTPAFIVNLIIIFLLIINQNKLNSTYQNRALLSGIAIGIASLYDFTATFLTIYVIATLIIFSSKTFKNILVLLCGYLFTYVYVFAYHFFAGDIVDYWGSFQFIKSIFPLFTQVRLNLIETVSLVTLFLLVLYIIVKIKISFDSKLIVIRKSLITLHILFIITILMSITTNLAFPQSFQYTMIPFIIYFSTLQESTRFNLANEIVLTLSGAAYILLQIL